MLVDLENDIEALGWVDSTIDSLEKYSLPCDIQFGSIPVRISEDTAAKIKDLLLEDRKRYREGVKMELICTMEQLKQELQNE